MVPIGHFMVPVTRGSSETCLYLGRARRRQERYRQSARSSLENPAARRTSTPARSGRPKGSAVPWQRRPIEVGDAGVLAAERFGHSLPGRTECGGGHGTGQLLSVGA